MTNKLAFKFLLRNFDKFYPDKTSPVHDSDKSNVNELFVSSVGVIIMTKSMGAF